MKLLPVAELPFEPPEGTEDAWVLDDSGPVAYVGVEWITLVPLSAYIWMAPVEQLTLRHVRFMLRSLPRVRLWALVDKSDACALRFARAFGMLPVGEEDGTMLVRTSL